MLRIELELSPRAAATHPLTHVSWSLSTAMADMAFNETEHRIPFITQNWGFPFCHGGTPSSHPLKNRLVPEINHPAIKGYPHDYGNNHLTSRCPGWDTAGPPGYLCWLMLKKILQCFCVAKIVHNLVHRFIHKLITRYQKLDS